MKTLSSILFASVLALSTSAFAQGHEHHGGAAPASEAQAQNLPEIDSAAKDKGGCEKCKKKGMGGAHMGHGDGGCPKAAALEDRIDELEKRLDLMQMLMMRGYR
jgi:hypothetical protein